MHRDRFNIKTNMAVVDMARRGGVEVAGWECASDDPVSIPG